MIDDGRFLVSLAVLSTTVAATALRGSRGVVRTTRMPELPVVATWVALEVPRHEIPGSKQQRSVFIVFSRKDGRALRCDTGIGAGAKARTWYSENTPSLIVDELNTTGRYEEYREGSGVIQVFPYLDGAAVGLNWYDKEGRKAVGWSDEGSLGVVRASLSAPAPTGPIQIGYVRSGLTLNLAEVYWNPLAVPSVFYEEEAIDPSGFGTRRHDLDPFELIVVGWGPSGHLGRHRTLQDAKKALAAERRHQQRSYRGWSSSNDLLRHTLDGDPVIRRP